LKTLIVGGPSLYYARACDLTDILPRINRGILIYSEDESRIIITSDKQLWTGIEPPYNRLNIATMEARGGRTRYWRSPLIHPRRLLLIHSGEAEPLCIQCRNYITCSGEGFNTCHGFKGEKEKGELDADFSGFEFITTLSPFGRSHSGDSFLENMVITEEALEEARTLRIEAGKRAGRTRNHRTLYCSQCALSCSIIPDKDRIISPAFLLSAYTTFCEELFGNMSNCRREVSRAIGYRGRKEIGIPCPHWKDEDILIPISQDLALLKDTWDSFSPLVSTANLSHKDIGDDVALSYIILSGLMSCLVPKMLVKSSFMAGSIDLITKALSRNRDSTDIPGLILPVTTTDEDIMSCVISRARRIGVERHQLVNTCYPCKAVKCLTSYHIQGCLPTPYELNPY